MRPQPYYYQQQRPPVPPPATPGRGVIWVALVLSIGSVGCFLYVAAIWMNDQSNALMMAADVTSMIRLLLIGLALLALAVLLGLIGILSDGR
jgi:tryptophan-rich sensory protein